MKKNICILYLQIRFYSSVSTYWYNIQREFTVVKMLFVVPNKNYKIFEKFKKFAQTILDIWFYIFCKLQIFYYIL